MKLNYMQQAGWMDDYAQEQQEWHGGVTKQARNIVSEHTEKELSAYDAGLRDGWAKCINTLVFHGYIDLDHGRAPRKAAPCKIGYVNAGHTIPEPHITS